MGYGATFGILGGHGPLAPPLNPPMCPHVILTTLHQNPMKPELEIEERNFVKFSKNDLISIIHANIQNSLCTFVAPCRHIILTKFHQNPTKTDDEEINLVKFQKLT